MACHPAAQAEPIPGYVLIERLGSGGYGEVWKASAPGGLFKAVKFIYGQMDESRAGQEVKALNRVKSVRHPFLLSIERIEIVDGQLLVVTELADETLIDRFEACRRDGAEGIPRVQLLRHLVDVSDALDYMVETFDLQHLDIKPGNLLLVGGRTKVADFGLVKELKGNDVTATGGVSPAYAPAEFFDGKVSRYSDQYSLAIVYQEMLTGFRPFPGTTPVQLAMQHSTSKPMLDPLPVYDRPIVARALSKDPNERFPSCRAFVEALIEAPTHSREEVTINVANNSSPCMSDSATEVPTEQPPRIDSDDERTAHLETMASPLLRLAQAGERDDFGREVVKIRPTLYIGLGGMGSAVIQHFRRRLDEAFGGTRFLPMIGMLVMDTDRQEIRASTCGNDGTSTDQALLTPLQKPDHYRAKQRDFLCWMDRRWFFGIPKSQATEGLRPLGRLALADNAEKVRAAIEEMMKQIAVTGPQAVGEIRRSAEPPRVVICSSINGGTGSGTVTDMIRLVQDSLFRLGMDPHGVSAILMHATSPKPADKEIARANAYATLTELNHLMRPELTFAGDAMLGLPRRSPQGEILSETYVVHLGDDLTRDDVHSAADSIAEYLFLEGATPLAGFLSQYRRGSRSSAHRDEPLVRSLGLYRIRFPRTEIARLVARICCRQLLARWHGDIDPVADAADDDPEGFSFAHRSRRLRDIGESEALHLATSLDLSQDVLLSSFEQTTESLLDGDPDKFCHRKVHEVMARHAHSRNVVDAASDLLRELDPAFGTGDLPLAMRSAARTIFEKRIIDAAREQSQRIFTRIHDWIAQMVADPARRLKPAFVGIETLLHWLLARIEKVQATVQEVQQERMALRSRLTGEKVTLAGKIAPKKASSTIELAEVAIDYCQSRLSEIGIESVLEIYRGVYRQTSEFRHHIVEVRQRLSREADLFLHATAAQESDRIGDKHPWEVQLLPGKAAGLLEAAVILARNLSSTAFYDNIDERINEQLLAERGGLWSVLTADDAGIEKLLIEDLPGVLLSAVTDSLESIDAASLFFEEYGSVTEAIRHIRRILDKAGPKLSPAGGFSHLILGVPNSPCGRTFRELVAAQSSAESTTSIAVPADVVFCVESAGLAVSRIAEEIIGHEPAFAEAGKKLVTRIDVAWPALHSVGGGSLRS